jgi:hypothetical protein
MLLSTGDLVVSVPAIALTDEQKIIWTEWIAALRSGKFLQGIQHLKKRSLVDGEWTNKYCCLGVVCDVIGEEGLAKMGAFFKAPSDSKVAWTLNFSTAPDEYLTSTLIEPVFSKLNLTALGFDVSIKLDYTSFPNSTVSVAVTLARLNDRHVSFDEIATIIEKAMTGGYQLENASAAQ